ncbi:hypothetical protein GGR57DRAFT_502894 [Xylariaceae sp. FL1272]|nr:hypothetical protein GGR57DRAFT_502894 [Xylariaceae sp. FL1272]
MTTTTGLENNRLQGHDMGFAMQKYLLLHNQHEELRLHLEELCPAATSPSVSPTRSFNSSNGGWRRPPPMVAVSQNQSQMVCSPTRLEPVLDESLVSEVASGEQKLFDVNESIKRALTELLNCEAVRCDRTMRTWVQTRLMETEKELRRGRRRRSSATVE